MKLFYLSDEGLLDDLRSGCQVCHKRRIQGRSDQLGAADIAERRCRNSRNKRTQHEQRWRIGDLVKRKQSNCETAFHSQTEPWRLKSNLMVQPTDCSYLHRPRWHQRLDDGLGLTFTPAVHTAEDADGSDQVLRPYHGDLTGGYAGALAAEGRNDRGVNVVAEVTRQSCSDLQRKKARLNFVSCDKDFSVK